MKVSSDSGSLNSSLSNGPNCKPFEPVAKSTQNSVTTGSNGSLLTKESKNSVAVSSASNSSGQSQPSALSTGKFSNHNSERKTPSNSSTNSDSLQQQKVSSFITGNHVSTGNSHSGVNKSGGSAGRPSNDSDATGRRKLSPVSREMLKRSEIGGGQTSGDPSQIRNPSKDTR